MSTTIQLTSFNSNASNLSPLSSSTPLPKNTPVSSKFHSSTLLTISNHSSCRSQSFSPHEKRTSAKLTIEQKLFHPYCTTQPGFTKYISKSLEKKNKPVKQLPSLTNTSSDPKIENKMYEEMQKTRICCQCIIA